MSVREPAPELRAIRDLAQAAEGAEEVEDLLRRVCESVAATFAFERIAIARYDAERGEIEPLLAIGLPDELVRRLPRSLEHYPILRRALESGESVFVPDVRTDPALDEQVAESLGISSALCVPLIVGGRCLGFLGCDRGGRPYELEAGQLDLLTTVGTLAAIFLEKALAYDELRRIDELKSQFIALASHELRTPAAVIYGIAQVLFSRGDELADEQRRELRRTLFEQTARMRRLVDQLLDLSRLEADAVRIAPEPVQVRSRVEEILHTVAGDRSGDVSVNVSSDLQAIVDPNAFERIVSNLVVNAIRHGDLPITVSAEQRDRHFRLAVEDRGDGVPREFVPRLFERFSRSRGGHRHVEGAGLGLAIAQSYAHAHGGELLYADAEPRGARFELVLPRIGL
jgi:signal transduction histidine kinase